MTFLFVHQTTPPMTCVILDDEPLALDLLADYCAQVPGLELKGQFDDPLAGLAFLPEDIYWKT